MPVIQLIDFKGDYWSLLWTGVTNMNTVTGTTETWLHVEAGPVALHNYPTIPVPVFDAWWIQ